MPIKNLPGGIRKLYCDPSVTREGCSKPDIKRGKDKCENGHTAKEMEAHRSDLDKFKELTKDHDTANDSSEKLPPTPGQVWDKVMRQDT